uniref:Hyp21 n=1 Tax=Moniliophthora roreri (strain MCA 2997) TaxID=1381753 RepID=F2WVL2_MONRO|nr:hyp21 [Moniliophthora roreri]ADO51604.1 hyp21 [Moniliophthora roreri]
MMFIIKDVINNPINKLEIAHNWSNSRVDKYSEKTFFKLEIFSINLFLLLESIISSICSKTFLDSILSLALHSWISCVYFLKNISALLTVSLSKLVGLFIISAYLFFLTVNSFIFSWIKPVLVSYPDFNVLQLWIIFWLILFSVTSWLLSSICWIICLCLRLNLSKNWSTVITNPVTSIKSWIFFQLFINNLLLPEFFSLKI